MIFITRDNIFELSDWELKTLNNNELPTVFHDLLNDIIPSQKNCRELYGALKREIENQILKNKYYVDFQEIDLRSQDSTTK